MRGMNNLGIDKYEDCTEENRGGEASTDCRDAFQQLLKTLGLWEFYPNKLSLNKVKEMNIETVEDKKSTSTTDIPWHFLRLLMEANSNARKQDTSEDGTSEDDFNSYSQSPNATAMSFHPLDIISAIFVCADTILQQEVILRMSLCQFAFPIVMPSPEGRPTFLMHPMRFFVRRYRPQSMRDRAGYIEECMGTSSLPTFAFVRFGNCSSSKSKLLNQVFSNSQPSLDYFVHSDMRCGDISRKVSDGMIEMIWYLPSGSKDIDIIPEAVAVMNLRGDAQNFPEHVQFLSKVATTLFVFIEHLNEQAEAFLFSNPQIQQRLFLIINSQVAQIYLHLERLIEAKLIAKDHILTKYRKNKEDFLRTIRSKLIEILRKGAEVNEEALSLQAMIPAARASKFLIDEDNNVISEAWGKSEEILRGIVSKGIKMIRERELYFQGDTWEKISGIDKEMCQLKSLSDANVSDYVSRLQREREDLCRALARRGMSNLMRQIILGLQTMGNQRKLFLNCLRNALESNSVTVSHSNIMLNLETEEQVQSQSIQEQLTEQSCFILILDTEGLRAQERSSLDGQNEHDNELATLVAGLSDLIIITMSTETASETKDILQIVVHALIRMKVVGKRPNCQFVHQMVGDVSAHQKNVGSHKSLHQELDTLTKIEAKTEGQDHKFSKFSDILDYDSKKNNWYIPGLWCGTPPMALVSMGYSQKVTELKHKILQHFLNRRPSTMQEFIRWMESTWNAVKHENFIFSFRNSLVADAYNRLSEKYSDLEWKLRSEVHSWLQKEISQIANCEGDLQELKGTLDIDVPRMISEKKSQILDEMERYFQEDTNQAHLIENFKAETAAGFDSLSRELETRTKMRCEEALNRRRDLNELNRILSSFSERIQEKIDLLLDNLKLKSTDQGDNELSEAFETIWREVMASVHFQPIAVNIEGDMEKSLRENTRTQGRILPMKLTSGKSLVELSNVEWKITEQHLGTNKTSFLDMFKGKLRAAYTLIRSYHQNKENLEDENVAQWEVTARLLEAKKKTLQLISQCDDYVEEIVKRGESYNLLLCNELLREVDRNLQTLDAETLKVNELLSTDVKIHVCGKAIQRFQEMYDRFCDKHNPLKRLANERHYYFTMFKSIYSEKDQSETCARLFCDSCLEPALLEALKQQLGSTIVDHLKKEQKIELTSRRNLQVGIMLYLKKLKSFDKYCQYFEQTGKFEQVWVKEQVLNHCKGLNNNKSMFYCIAQEVLQQKLVTDSCTATATAIYLYQKDKGHWEQRFFRNIDELLLKRRYIEMQCEEYSSWNIPSNPKARVPSYWKWVLYTYNKEFAEKYKVNPARNISNWNIPWEKIVSELEAEYGVKVGETGIIQTSYYQG
ncbi:interferon-induced very large GTPase 1-like [Chiloscyllium plagiosum]|uniref:interferon-induced very large GTPase 1-like n=1 Tax=Chiloscyllium plagiosum TaxID=36176 RepID=UPI001CB8662C|nr:interferon-induced very large GTPase 1-like [Chiloscyllium plagiosum]